MDFKEKFAILSEREIIDLMKQAIKESKEDRKPKKVEKQGRPWMNKSKCDFYLNQFVHRNLYKVK